jgi:transcriptional regulator with XRE-family HTH domain
MIAAATLIKEARRRAGLTQTELAHRLRTTQSSIARLESPGSNPRLDTLDRAIGATGQRIEVSVGPDFGLDESLIASALRMEPGKRLRRFASAYRSARTLGEAGKRALGP